jgi:hypothetical protein
VGIILLSIPPGGPMEKFVHDGHASREGVLAAPLYTEPKATATSCGTKCHKYFDSARTEVRPKIMLYQY